MATLNIKSFPDALYARLRARAKREQRSMSQEVIALLSHALASSDTVSILQLKGLGKERWVGIEGEQYIADERASWD